ncbi:MAG: transglycosylase SLT domain-containing protein [Bacteroidia bacterium]|nr:transglycosylase SLT domain-containing protein [Bacteroidia bacterium]
MAIKNRFFKSLFLTLILGLLVAPAIAQKNSLSRIDSLTQCLFHSNADKAKANLTQDEVNSISEEQFNELSASLGTIISFKLNDAVRLQMRYMKDPSSGFLRKASDRKDIYFRIFEEVLDKKGLPQEIKYLSVIESALNPNAESWCGAMGLWQFMPATGRMMDLEINNWIDERKDLYKSTEKACDYLQSNYNRFGDWLLAIAAYNCGPGNVSKAITRSGGKRTFWEIKNYLPRETQNYIPKFLATAFLMNFSPASDETNNRLENEELMVQVPLTCDMHFKYISAVLGISTESIEAYNSTYKTQFVNCSSSSGLSHPLVLPYSDAMQLVQMHDSIMAISGNTFDPNDYIKREIHTYYHKAGKGETLGQIANRFDCNVSELKKWNHIRSGKIKPGQNIKIQEIRETCIPVVNPSHQKFFYYLVENDNSSLNSICSRFAELDIEKTKAENFVASSDAAIAKGTLIKIYTKAVNN